ncbi:MAG: hypothetical protein ACLGIC_04585 [Acidimicrobiia bacterium]
MGERVGNPVPKQIRAQLERGEHPLVYELVTRPKAPFDGDGSSWAGRFAAAIATDDQHELLLTAQRIAVVTTDRRSKEPTIAVSVPRDEVVAVDAAGSGLERGRVRFEFRDGSVAHGVMGLALPRPARRFLAAHEASDPRRRRPGGRR